MSSKGNNNSD